MGSTGTTAVDDAVTLLGEIVKLPTNILQGIEAAVNSAVAATIQIPANYQQLTQTGSLTLKDIKVEIPLGAIGAIPISYIIDVSGSVTKNLDGSYKVTYHVKGTTTSGTQLLQSGPLKQLKDQLFKSIPDAVSGILSCIFGQNANIRVTFDTNWTTTGSMTTAVNVQGCGNATASLSLPGGDFVWASSLTLGDTLTTTLTKAKELLDNLGKEILVTIPENLKHVGENFRDAIGNKNGQWKNHMDEIGDTLSSNAQRRFNAIAEAIKNITVNIKNFDTLVSATYTIDLVFEGTCYITP
jgi:hypothetical protein